MPIIHRELLQRFPVLQLKWERLLPNALKKALLPNLLSLREIGQLDVRKNALKARLSTSSVY
jgi:hypothetical protein